MSINLPTRHLISQQDSSVTARADVPRSRLTGSWSRKQPFDAGLLVPFLVEEILPGDHVKYDVTAYVRMSTPLFPLFDNQRVDTFFFFVPCRLVWDNWQRFQGEQRTPSESIALTVPQVTNAYTDSGVGTLWDYMGLPVFGLSGVLPVNAMPFRSYYLIYQEWFRDENLVASTFPPVDNGPDTVNYSLLRRAKSHDYFTSALPWPQKFTAPSVPLLGNAPVRGLGTSTTGSIPWPYYEVGTGAVSWSDAYASTGGNILAFRADVAPFADLSLASGVNINQLRQTFAIQSLLEKEATGGTRYTEKLRRVFGVISPDARMQRPEYIGGGSTPLNLTPIAQTAPSAGAVVGALGASGTAAGSHRASYAATEHGYILGLVSVKSELSYQRGLRRLWSRSTQYDFYVPPLAGLGEQAILRQEIYCVGNPALDQLVFGYQERWHEYRTHVSEVCGLFRSGVAGTIDQWHLAQHFTTPPTLSDVFIGDEPPMSRVLAAGSLAAGQQYLADFFIKSDLVRLIPAFGEPSVLGRF